MTESWIYIGAGLTGEQHEWLNWPRTEGYNSDHLEICYFQYVVTLLQELFAREDPLAIEQIDRYTPNSLWNQLTTKYLELMKQRKFDDADDISSRLSAEYPCTTYLEKVRRDQEWQAYRKNLDTIQQSGNSSDG